MKRVLKSVRFSEHLGKAQASVQPYCGFGSVYEGLYRDVVHGLGVCNYFLGCSEMCLHKHMLLREHSCFVQYMNFRSYLCPKFDKIGRICGSDLAAQCHNPSEYSLRCA